MVYSNKFVMCVLIDGKPVKELANGEVHIPFNKEYVLRFRNKNDRRAVVKFWIDGELCSGDGGYVIEANDYIDIKRHSKRDRAFVLVPLDSGEAVDAGKNGPNYDKQKGVVKAEFTLEKKREKVVYRDIHHHHDHYYPRPVPVPRPWNPYPIRPLYTCGGVSEESGFGGVTHDLSKGLTNSVSMSAQNSGAEMSAMSFCDAEPTVSAQNAAPSPVQDGCTVEGNTTGQRFTTTWVDVEESSTVLQIFLRGKDEGNEFPAHKPQEAKPRRRVTEKSDDLESENERLKRELEEAKKKKSLEEENERLRRELEKYTG